jgi:hypothetical protein
MPANSIGSITLSTADRLGLRLVGAQVELLEHESDVPSPVFRQLAVRHAGQAHAVDEDVSAGGLVQGAEQGQQVLLPLPLLPTMDAAFEHRTFEHRTL